VSITPRVNLIRFGFVARSLGKRVLTAFWILGALVTLRGAAQHRIAVTATPANKNLMHCEFG